MFCMSYIYQSFTGFYPTYLLDAKGFDETTVSVIFGGFFGLGILIQPAAGAVSDRIGAKRTVGALLAMTLLGLVTLPVLQRPVHVGLLTVLLGAQLGFWPVAFTLMVEALSPEVQGSGLGVVRAVYLILAASGPVFGGIDRGRGRIRRDVPAARARGRRRRNVVRAGVNRALRQQPCAGITKTFYWSSTIYTVIDEK